MKVYIAGPMTGYVQYNYPAFHAAAKELRGLGFDVSNPAEHFDGDLTLPYATYLKAAIQALIECQAIFLLEGWERSRGANLELGIARALGLKRVTLSRNTHHTEPTALVDPALPYPRILT